MSYEDHMNFGERVKFNESIQSVIDTLREKPKEIMCIHGHTLSPERLDFLRLAFAERLGADYQVELSKNVSNAIEIRLQDPHR